MTVNEEQVKNTIAANIARLRRQLNLTQAELAEKLNYSDKAVSKWERAEGIPDVYILVQMSEIFGVTVDGLLSETPEQKPAPRKPSAKVRALVPVMSALALFFIATTVFSLLTMLSVHVRDLWLLFVYVLPGAAIIFTIFSAVWDKSFSTALAVSALIWSLALCLFLTFTLENKYLFFIIALPLQVLTGLGYWLFRSHKRKK
ncbi:hypothetical protein FACS1894211_10600 [Clostridia bacterium]|nr:hypothetical protein FACS1894211_10600 [Clostridia bacterium]